MSEKRGMTGKMQYDFDTAGVCEIMSADGRWFRVTSREFRSYDGPRKLTFISGPALLGRPQDEEMTTVDYVGPVYLHGTNKVVKAVNCHMVRYNI